MNHHLFEAIMSGNLVLAGVFMRELLLRFMRERRHSKEKRTTSTTRIEVRERMGSVSDAKLDALRDEFKEALDATREEMREDAGTFREEMRSEHVREKGARHVLQENMTILAVEMQGRVSRLEALSDQPARLPPPSGRMKSRPPI